MAVIQMATGLDANLEAITRSTDLHALERIVSKGKLTFLEVGVALWRIREAKLYKSTHTTWESWCADRWWGSKRTADRQISAARVVVELGHFVPKEMHALEIAKAPEAERSDVVEEIERRVDSGEKVTAEDVKAIVDEKAGKAKPPSIQDRRTPQWFFDVLNKRFGPFNLDAFSSDHNALCAAHFTDSQDGCNHPWVDVTFANPPFEDMRGPVAQAVRQAESGIRSIVLGPVGCSQDWYHQLAIKGTVYVPNKRINFDLPDGTPTRSADRDTIVMGFGGEHENKDWEKGFFRVRRLELD